MTDNDFIHQQVGKILAGHAGMVETKETLDFLRALAVWTDAGLRMDIARNRLIERRFGKPAPLADLDVI